MLRSFTSAEALAFAAGPATAEALAFADPVLTRPW
jgi:hypothetical protein